VAGGQGSDFVPAVQTFLELAILCATSMATVALAVGHRYALKTETGL